MKENVQKLHLHLEYIQVNVLLEELVRNYMYKSPECIANQRIDVMAGRMALPNIDATLQAFLLSSSASLLPHLSVVWRVFRSLLGPARKKDKGVIILPCFHY